MLNRDELLKLMKTVAKADRSAAVAYSFGNENFSYSALDETLRKELNEYSKDYYSYEENKNMIFRLLAETIDDILPKKVTKQYEAIAETKIFGQGDKPVFKRRINGAKRIQQFITRVGLAGVYEVARLGKNEESFEVPTSALGGGI